MATLPDPRADRLYALLPAIHRMRDADNGYPLKALLAVIAEQVNVVEDDIAQLYENWFIETAQDWAVPYIGDLLGYVPVADAGLPPDSAAAPPPVLVPRREIANLIRDKRGKGTLALLERLANEVAGWAARPVETFKLLGRTQNINHLWPQRHRLVDLREGDALDRLGGAFEAIAHGVDRRRLASALTRGRSGIADLALFVWRLQSFSVTNTPAYCAEKAGPNCYTFSVLGQDAPLFTARATEDSGDAITGELDVPAVIRRRAFDQRPGDFYPTSLAIRADGWGGLTGSDPIPLDRIVPTDLSGWHYVPARNTVAVDPVLGRIAFPPSQLPKKGVRVNYRYGFSGAIGGGEYARPPAPTPAGARLYQVGEGLPLRRIGDALAQWQTDAPDAAIIEIVGSGVFVEPLSITLGDGQTLLIRAAPRSRPIIRLIDWQTDLPDAMLITLGRASRIGLDGLFIAGRPLRIEDSDGQDQAGDGQAVDPAQTCLSQVDIRHCTLVPGWEIGCDCEPERPAEASLELENIRAAVCISSSILGTIQLREDELRQDPIPITIADSIVDATDNALQAIGGVADGIAYATLTIRNSTVFGIVEVHSVALAENSIFSGCVHVARRQIGCMRYCYVPCGCRTPRRYRCQPDGVDALVKAQIDDPVRRAAVIAAEELRVRPQFTARRFGTPGYTQLGETCADEIKRGADDESEMGAWHHLYQPQRAAALAARLLEFTPAGADVGIIFVN